MDPFASPHNLDREFHSFLAEASSTLCYWFAESGSLGPMPDSFDMPEAFPNKKGLSNEALLNELQLFDHHHYEVNMFYFHVILQGNLKIMRLHVH